MPLQYGFKRVAILKALSNAKIPVNSKAIQSTVINLMDGKNISVHELSMILLDLSISGEVIKHPRDKYNPFRWSINRAVIRT